jgi:predicted RNA-binding Zn ribbon-like protein
MEQRTADNLELVGGHLCLDFANTVSTRAEGLGQEYLSTYGDLVAWSRHSLVLSEDEASALMDQAVGQPERAAAALERAIALREALYRTVLAMVEGRDPDRADLSQVNAALHGALAHLALVPSADGFEWTWILDEGDLGRMLWPIARSAAELLTSEALGRVRQCARPGCDWLFVDMSKNHSRRWCSMAMCGSRIKARRYYRRRTKRE